MMRKTHLALIIFLILVFVPFMQNKILFTVFALLASLIPDIDSEYSSIGRFRFLRIFQFFTKHRGFLHSLTFCIGLSVVLALFIPILAFPVFLGYATHLMFDSITIEGIQPFWPMKRRTEGRIRTNSHVEQAIFLSLVLLSVLMVIFRALEVM